MKICTKCKETKNLIEFDKRKVSKDGLQHRCKTCNLLYRTINKQTRDINRKLYYNKNLEAEKLKNKIYKKLNSAKHNALQAKYRASKLQATPKWLTKNQLNQIESLYKLSKTIEKITNIKYHVDHIIPLQGENVSGLHVPWNLRVITASENLSKSNKH